MTNAPRVLVLGSVLGQGVGGVQRHNSELLPRAAELLNARGGSLSVLEGTSPCSFPLPDSIERIPSNIPARPVLRRALAEGHALRRVLRERADAGRPFGVVHTAHQPVPRGFETPLTVLIHDLRSLQRGHSPFSRRLIAQELLGRSARRAARLMTVSESMAKELQAQLGVERDAICVIPNGGDHFTPRTRDVQPGAPMLCIGHLEARKNQELLLRALASDPDLPAVNFVGAAKGDELDRLQALARELQVAERVRFLGAVDDDALLDLLARTSCVVLPSRLEGFGIVVLEAQLARAPLAISRIPAHLEVSAPGTPAFEDDPRDCARAVREASALGEAQLNGMADSAERYRWNDSALLLVDAWCAAANELDGNPVEPGHSGD